MWDDYNINPGEYTIVKREVKIRIRKRHIDDRLLAGKLHLTNKRLFYKPFTRQKKYYRTIFLEDINMIEQIFIWKHKYGIRVDVADDEPVEFYTGRGPQKKWVVEIAEAINENVE